MHLLYNNGFHRICSNSFPSPPVNIVWAVMILWRISGKLSELFCAELCMTVVHNDTHTREQFLKMSVGLGLGLVCVFV